MRTSMRVRVCLFSHYTVEAFYGRGSSLDLFRTAVPFWGQSTQISSSQSPKRDCGTRKGSTPHPKTDVSKKSNCIPMKHPMAQLYIPSFKKKKSSFQRFWVKKPRHSETFCRKCATIIVERVRSSYPSTSSTTR